MPTRPIIGDAPGSPFGKSLTSFSTATGVHPSLVEYYTKANGPFDPVRACQVERAGAMPFIQLDPRTESLRSIAAGSLDASLTRYATEVQTFRAPIAIGFGHEMNGNWYPWGWPHTTPREFITAWRHVYRLFAAVGATNVTWVWTVNRDSPWIRPLANYWPGGKYVDWVGLTAYYDTPQATFRALYGGSLRSIRRLTKDPVIIAETAIAPGPHAAQQVKTLFTGIRKTPGVLGFVWFDINGREHWHIEDDPVVLRTFRHSAATLKPGFRS